MENRAFNEMLKAARGWLSDRAPEEIARSCGADFDARRGVFSVCSLGREIHISYPDYAFEEPLSDWHKLVILHYFLHADGFPVKNRLISFGQLRDGMIRGGGFDRDCEKALSALLKGKTEAELRRMIASLGGSFQESRADLCAVLPFLPNYPVTLNIYFADDEFEAEGRMLLDESADHYLPVEDAVTAGSIILEQLEAMK